jgi:glycosyltransferase involved in cell wall biosynthesis
MAVNKSIFYLTTAKVGLHSFTFTELSLLKQKGIPFILGLVQLHKGPFMPKQEWPTLVFNMKSFLIFLLFVFLKKPIRYSHLIAESIKDHHFKYLLIATYFDYKLRKNEISDIHVQMGDHKLFIGYYLSKLMGVNLTATIHAHELYQPIAYDNKPVMQKALNACFKILTISEFNKQLLIDSFGIEPNKILVMYLYPSNIKEEDQVYRKKILIVASWIQKKGYKELLQALKEIKQVRDDFTLWVVGTDIKTQDQRVPIGKECGFIGVAA